MPQLKIPHAATMIEDPLCHSEDLVAQLVKNLPAMQETWVQSMGWEDPQEKGKAILSTPVFWPGEFHGVYSTWSCKESTNL